MSEDRKISLSEAYAVETPDDSIQLYKDWADTYDEDFIAATGYVGVDMARDVIVLKVDAGRPLASVSLLMSPLAHR